MAPNNASNNEATVTATAAAVAVSSSSSSSSSGSSSNFFQHLTLCQLFSRLAKFYLDGKYVSLYVRLVLLLYMIPMAAVMMSVVGILMSGVDIYDSEVLFIFYYRQILLIVWLHHFSNAFFGAIAEGAIGFAVAEVYAGRLPHWEACLQAVRHRLCALSGAVVISFVVVLVILSVFEIPAVQFVLPSGGGVLFTVIWILFAVPGLWLFCSWFVMPDAIVVESIRSPVAGLRRSYELSTGNRCYIFACFFILLMIQYMIKYLASVIFTLGYHHAMLLTVSGSFVYVLVMSLFVPAYSILKAILYLGMRIDKEGLNANVLSRDLGPGSIARTAFAAVAVPVVGEPTTIDYRRVPLLEENERADTNHQHADPEEELI